MIAILLTAIAVIGISALYSVATRSSAFTRHNTEPRSPPRTRWSGCARSQPRFRHGQRCRLRKGRGFGPYTRTWTIATNANWVTFTVVVSWTEEGNPRSISLTSNRGYEEIRGWLHAGRAD